MGKAIEFAKMPSRCSEVTHALREITGDAEIELVRGEGYFYFVGLGSEGWSCDSVGVCSIRDFTIERWIKEFFALAGEAVHYGIIEHEACSGWHARFSMLLTASQAAPMKRWVARHRDGEEIFVEAKTHLGARVALFGVIGQNGWDPVNYTLEQVPANS